MAAVERSDGGGLKYDPDAAVAHLRAADSAVARVIDAVGPFTLRPRDGPYRMLARAVFFQQLAGPAARAIMNRVLAALETDEERFFTAQQFLAASDELLQPAGLSRQKIAYLRDLSEKFGSGHLGDGDFDGLDDEEVILRVTAVKGIGRWTAEMLLIFCLGRPDVLPVDDLGVRRGFMQVYGLAELPGGEEMRRLAEAWRPYRSVGTWYMWRSLGVTLPAQTIDPSLASTPPPAV
ncbi:MAG: DNA-3-methyladenine glycosylase 2 family protein [Chloroflexi bacterium]|nr:DNA-3-methyladenine glycosylase 2 family protein [Chloroflexota bacterium]